MGAVMAEEQRTNNTSNPAASMDQDDNVAFKVHLRTQNKEEEEEVRRFTLERSSCSYQQLVSQLVAMFPQLEAAVYAVSWTDEEGDAVTVSSQEELGIAMEEMAGPVYRFRIVVKEQRKMKQRETSSLTASRGTAIMLPPMLVSRMKMIQERIRKIEERQKIKEQQNGNDHGADTSAQPLKLPPMLVKNMQKLQARMIGLEERQRKKDLKRATQNLDCSGSSVVLPPRLVARMKIIQERIKTIEKRQKKTLDGDETAALKFPPRLIQNMKKVQERIISLEERQRKQDLRTMAKMGKGSSWNPSTGVGAMKKEGKMMMNMRPMRQRMMLQRFLMNDPSAGIQMMRQLRRIQNRQNIGGINLNGSIHNGSGGVRIKPWMQRQAPMMQGCNEMRLQRQIQKKEERARTMNLMGNNFGQQNGRTNFGCAPGRQALIGGMWRHRAWGNAAMKNGGRAYGLIHGF